MKKVYSIVIAIVIAGFVAFYLHKERSSTFRKQDTLFAIADIKKINRIEIASDNNRLKLVNEPDGWKINEKLINKDKMADLLILAENLEVVSPASKSDYDTLSVKLNEGIVISFYSGRKLVNSFRICKWEMKIFASRAKSKKIFQIEAKGYPNVDLTKVFNPEISHWQYNSLMSFSPDEISLISINYPEKSSRNFKLKRTSQDQYKLTDHRNTDVSDFADKEFIDIYLHFFRNLTYSSELSINQADSVVLTEPFFILIVESDKAVRIELQGYRILNKENKKPAVSEFYGKTGKSKPVKLKYTDYDPILLELKDFLKK